MKTRSNKSISLNKGLTFDPKKKLWISPTKIRNALTSDHLIDYISLCHEHDKIKVGPTRDEFLFFLFEQGDAFEEAVIKYIEKNIHPVINLYGDFRKTNKHVKQLMEHGVPFISSVPLKNQYTAVRGVADLLVRSDFINLIVPGTYTEEQMYIQAPKLKTKTPYHYVVIEIKFSTIYIYNNNDARSSNNLMYLAQAYLYSKALSYIQGYMAPTYILGKKYSLNVKGGKPIYINNSLKHLAKVNITDDLIKTTNKAIHWVRKVNKEWSNWRKLDNINKIKSYQEYMHPNMCVVGNLYKEKVKLAKEMHELTLITSVGINERNTAFSNGVTAWNDKRCCAEIMGITNPIRSNIINSIISVNRDEDKIVLPVEKIIIENKTKNNVYIDFEIIQDLFGNFDSFPVNNNTQLIFMIGALFNDTYTSFIVNDLTLDEEGRIMTLFIDYLNSLPDDTTVWYWHAENNFWNSALSRHTKIKSSNKIIWRDLLPILKSKGFAVKGCFTYSLKDITKALVKNNLITDYIIDTDCKDGITASLMAWRYYNGKKETDSVIRDIEKYNFHDCLGIEKIYKFIN